MSYPPPPMGWNSFDCFGSTVTESEILENARILADRLLPFGWNHVVVDYCWSHPSPPASTNPNQMSENQPYLAMDSDFRLLPAPERFPSAANGRGFAPLAEKIHAMGLKFGIHIMRGFPRQGLYPGYPARTLGYRPLEIADPTSECKWLNHMIGVKLPGKAGQDYYNHLFKLYASWNVDFIKTDDISYPYREAEIEAVNAARQACGRPMTLSLSPGPCEVKHADHVARHADLWRICADFWDDWGKLKEAFEFCRAWAPHRRPDRWPDADMLPIGRLSKRGPVGPEHDSYFTPEEHLTLMTLWCIFRSPLFIGGNLPEMNEETMALLTNPEVLAVHREGLGGHPAHQDEKSSIWLSQGPGKTVYVAYFNLSDVARDIGTSWDQLGIKKAPASGRDLWQRKDIPVSSHGQSVPLPPHSAALFSFELSSAYQHGTSNGKSSFTPTVKAAEFIQKKMPALHS